MASPIQNGAPNTPPASDPALKNGDNKALSVPDAPLTSLDDDGSAKRPRDARLLHAVLHNLGVQHYQERVPLQLLDFAYRYTSSVLSDALRLSAEGYSGSTAEKRRGAGAKDVDDAAGITVVALRQAIASRQGDSFENTLPKEFMLEQAAERNRVALPKVDRGFGVQLPEEKYCLTGVGWGLKEEWDPEPAEPVLAANGLASQNTQEMPRDQEMGGVDGVNEHEEDDEDDEGAGKMEDVFGDDTNMEDS